jgi:hypothetical protein
LNAPATSAVLKPVARFAVAISPLTAFASATEIVASPLVAGSALK